MTSHGVTAGPPVEAMMTTTTTSSTETFDTLNPATSEIIATFPVCNEADVTATVARAEAAAQWWAGLSWKDRRQRLLAWKSHVIRYVGRLAELVHRETGKPLADAVLEITLAIDHIDWAAGHAQQVLGPRRVRPGLMAANRPPRSSTSRSGWSASSGRGTTRCSRPWAPSPTPWPAGNAVVFKPSEYTPAIGGWLVDAWAEAVPEGGRCFSLVTGFGETGAALCRSGVDKIAFTGSAATGRKVMAACAESLVPVLMECGGKDALLVDADADLDAAADAALWGGMSNGGQTCVGTERVYVADAVYDRSVDSSRQGAALAPGSGEGARPLRADHHAVPGRHHPSATSPTPWPGAGGRGRRHRRPSDGPVVGPMILVDVPEDSEAVARGDVRPDPHRHPGTRHRGRAGPGQRHPTTASAAPSSPKSRRRRDRARPPDALAA